MDWENEAPFKINTSNALEDMFLQHCREVAAVASLDVDLSKQRIIDVFEAWQEDIDRNQRRNFRNKDISPDHIKCGAFLTYWLRRESPIINFKEVLDRYSFDFEVLQDMPLGASEYTPLSSDELNNKLSSGLTLQQVLDIRERCFAYGNEWLAFSFGFSLAIAYERKKLAGREEAKALRLPNLNYTADLCYMFKFKNMSPHAIYMIYRALLLNY
ncbi:MAG: hypothetical protein Q8O33_13555 [Pseudomonadota bacterium]|nr:hypothetical protein [Pseudomonadota bacterium]